MTILVRHSDGSDTQQAGGSPVAADPTPAQRLSRFHRRHQRQEFLHWLAVLPIVLVVAWAVIAGASSLFIH